MYALKERYKNEIREFFDVVLYGKNSLYGFEQDQEILNLIDVLGA